MSSTFIGRFLCFFRNYYDVGSFQRCLFIIIFINGHTLLLENKVYHGVRADEHNNASPVTDMMCAHCERGNQ
jgi:hypothetical protein